MNRPPLILASASPRRKELLASLGLAFEVRPSDLDESSFVATLDRKSPGETVVALAREKALDIARQEKSEALVLGADTIVVLNNETLGKPQNPEDAVEMLMTLSGQTHQVYTGIALIHVTNGVIDSTRAAHSVTDVMFSRFDEARARSYVATGEPLDKAGAYGIQAIGTLLIPRIRGDYFNVVGLPLFLLGQMLEDAGWPLL